MAVLSLSTNRCRACGVEKPIGEFYKARNRHGALYADNLCKVCRSERVQSARRSFKASNPVAERARRRQYKADYRRRKGCRLRSDIAAACANRKEAEALARRPQCDAHVRRWRRVVKARERERRKMLDPSYVLGMRMKTAIGKALRGGKAGRKWENLVGYTLHDLKRHLERQFVPGMSWSNIGQWHIDHIIPKSVFRYQTTDDPCFKRAWSMDNLQPLWAADNLAKGASLPCPLGPQNARF